MPLIPLDLSKLPESWITQILSAIFPGGVLALGICVTHQPLIVQLLKYEELSGLAKSALGIFVSFALGYLLMLFGGCLLLLFYFLGYSVVSVARTKLNSIPDECKNVVWRRIVAYSLPRQLVAVEEPSISTEALKSRLTEVASKVGAKDPNALVESLAMAGGIEVYRDQVDQEWKYMYSVLQCYFFKPPPSDVWIAVATQFAVSIALGVSAGFGTFMPTALWTLSILNAVAAALVSLFFGASSGFANPFEAINGANVLKEWLSPKSPPTPSQTPSPARKDG